MANKWRRFEVLVYRIEIEGRWYNKRTNPGIHSSYDRGKVMEFQTILDAVRSLAAEDRVRLVHVIQNELQAEGIDPDLTPAGVQEVKRRLAAFDADPSVGVPSEDVEARMHKHLKELGE
jgi:putative addiction module component (TIGR02574 family)